MSQRARLSSEYKDIFPGPSSSEPGAGIEINGVYYFFADDGVHGYELWRSNGTTGGTSQVVDLNASEAQLVAKDDTHMWFAPVNSDNSLCAIWQSDGTQAGTFLLIETHLHAENPDETECRGVAAVVAGSLFFRDFDNEHGRELWLAKSSQPNPQRYPCLYRRSSNRLTMRSFLTCGNERPPNSCNTAPIRIGIDTELVIVGWWFLLTDGPNGGIIGVFC